MKTNLSKEEVAKKLLNAKNVAIFCHVSPDGDTVGCSVALHYALEQKGIKSSLFCSDAISEKYIIKPYVPVFYQNINENEFDLFVSVDVSSINRLGVFTNVFENNATTLCIDHHKKEVYFAKYEICNYKLVSCCELMYEIIENIDCKMTKSIATYLFMGIVADSGCFRFQLVSSDTLLKAQNLIKIGIDKDVIIDQIFRTKTRKALELEKLVYKNLKFYYKDKVAISYVSYAFKSKFGFVKEDSNNVSNLLLENDGVDMGIFIFEKKYHQLEVSLRSRNGINVRDLAEKFNGGGHANASGFQYKGGIREVIKKLLKVIKKMV